MVPILLMTSHLLHLLSPFSSLSQYPLFKVRLPLFLVSRLSFFFLFFNSRIIIILFCSLVFVSRSILYCHQNLHCHIFIPPNPTQHGDYFKFRAYIGASYTLFCFKLKEKKFLKVILMLVETKT